MTTDPVDPDAPTPESDAAAVEGAGAPAEASAAAQPGATPLPVKGTRCFLAFDLPEDIRTRVTELQQRLRKGAQFTSARPMWVASQNFHITLHFLGVLTHEAIQGIIPKLDALAAKHIPKDLKIAGLGVFPHARNPKVLWVGVEQPPDSVMHFHRQLANLLEGERIIVDHTEWHPHVTLARIKSMKGIEAFLNVVQSHRHYGAGTFKPRQLTLFQSVLGREGPTYSVLHQSPLAK